MLILCPPWEAVTIFQIKKTRWYIFTASRFIYGTKPWNCNIITPFPPWQRINMNSEAQWSENKEEREKAAEKDRR